MIRFLSDESELEKLIPLFISEGLEIGTDVTQLNREKLLTTLRACLHGAAILVSEEDGIFTGTMTIVPIESYWSDDVTWLNLLYYVLPAHRKSTIAVKLLRLAKEYALRMGMAGKFHINVETLTDIERKDKFFERHGFKKLGGFYRLGERNGG